MKEMNLLKSPLNFTGGKYKLLPQILPLFPKDIDTFIDLFGGGFNVGINVNAKKIVYNDSMTILPSLFLYWYAMDSDTVIDDIDSVVSKYELSNTSQNGYEFYGCNSNQGVGSYNKEKFIRLRNDFNRTRDISLFFPMLCFAFNNQIRFNSDGDFNLVVNKRDFNKNIRKNTRNFIDALGSKHITFRDDDFREVILDAGETDFVYIDPPYLNTTATYNERDGWCENREYELYASLDVLNDRGVRFAVSNVFENKGSSNEIVKEWSKKYHVHYLNHSYKNCSYQAKDKSESTVEVLITNYIPTVEA